MSNVSHDVEASMRGLSLSSCQPKLEAHTLKSKGKQKQKFKDKEDVVESWEEEEEEEEEEAGSTCTDSDAEVSSSKPKTPRRGSENIPNAPPPTPISPSRVHATLRPSADDFTSPWTPPSSASASASSSDMHPRSSSGSRPEKTDAVARRMIAGALGVRPPRKTEEQREYEKAVREREARRLEREREVARERRAEAERAKAAIWEDD